MFKNKTVVVTGASAGVGAACARTFAELGANLVLVARGEVALNAITQELQKKTSVLPVLMDVANIHDCKSLMEKAFNEFAAIHVLINNAGLHRRGEVESRSPQDLVATVDVNLRAPLQLTAEALPYIRQAVRRRYYYGGLTGWPGSLAGGGNIRMCRGNSNDYLQCGRLEYFCVCRCD